jgi:hypothetical protein
MDDKKYAPVFAHNPIEELFENVFWVHGSIKMAPCVTMNRNMIILRQDDELILVNPVRLNDQEEAKLCALGKIKKVLRLGDFHGLDDQYYIDRFNAEFWCQTGQCTYPTPKPDIIIRAETPPPIENSEFFIYSKAKFPEAALLLKTHKLLITTDSVQHFVDGGFTSLPAKIILRLMGFKKELLIGKPWIKRVTPKGGSMRGDFERLLELDFVHLVAAHGTLLRDNAKTTLKQVVANTF